MICQFVSDLDEVDYSINWREDDYILEIEGEEKRFKNMQKLRWKVVDYAERELDLNVIWELSLSSGKNSGSKLFEKYVDCLEEYVDIDTDSHQRFSWDSKQINARIIY